MSRVALDGEALRLVRTLNRRSTTSLAEAVGVTPAALCHVERGRRASVTEAVFGALVRELGISARPDWITPVVAAVTPSGSPSRLPSSIGSGSLSGVGDNTPAAA